MKSSFCSLALGAIFCVTGCGDATSVVTGEVTYHDKPVVSGTLSLVADGGARWQALIRPDGKYTVERVPHGNYRVEVVSTDPTPTLPPPVAIPEKWANRKEKKEVPNTPELPGWVPIPENYAKLETSGLTVNVNAATVVFDVPLHD